MKNLFNLMLICFSAVMINACYYDNKDDLYDYVPVVSEEKGCDSVTISYSMDLVSILETNCNLACHNAVDKQGNVVLETYNNVSPYVTDGSLLGSIEHADGFAAMPVGGKLSNCDLDKFRSWITNGAPNN